MLETLNFPRAAALSLLAISATFLFTPSAHALEVGDAAPCVQLLQVYPDASEPTQCIREHTTPTQKFTAIEFFSIDCSDCAKNLPTVSTLSGEIASTTQTRLVSIDKNEARVRDFLVDQKALIKFPVAFDLDRDAKKAYGVVATPTLFLLDANNQIVYKHVGVLSASDVTTIKNLVK